MKKRFRVRHILHGYAEKVVEADDETQAKEIAEAIETKPKHVMPSLSSDGIMGGFDVDVDEVSEDEEDLTELTEDDKRNIAQALEWFRRDRENMAKAAASLGLPLN